MAAAETALITAAITVGLSGAVGYGLYKVITVKGEATKALDYGRKWLAWMVSIGTMSTLPRFFRLFDVDSLARWLIVVVFYGAVAFVAGWLYGKVFGSKSQAGQDASNNITSQDAKVHQTNAASESIESRLETLKSLFQKGSITQEEYEMKRKEILNSV